MKRIKKPVIRELDTFEHYGHEVDGEMQETTRLIEESQNNVLKKGL
ncbi:MAG: hypothetical protein ACYCX2_07555 [Christensenellales bacterium]